jgi:hypothetical protein
MKQETRITEAIEDFNFELVHAFMLIKDWRWSPQNRVPTIEEMKQTCRSLGRALLGSGRPNTRCATGGFEFCRWVWDDGSIEISLRLNLAAVSRTMREEEPEL